MGLKTELNSPVILLNILQNICITPTTRDVHLSIIKVFFGAKHIVTFSDI